ncbi:MAG TPA: ABC transporter substrate-binding protein [Thermoleophilaceae bacterium]|nr:ABC transporter substrate-binding protein [Thermoleophilaceae bacterium]
MKIRNSFLVAGLAAVAILAAGCGGTDSSPDSATAASKSAIDVSGCGKSPGKAASGAPIRVGAVIGKSGPADLSSASLSAKAYFDCVNANGGIGGRPIQYSVVDDAWNPAKSNQVAKELVQDKGVTALVGSFSFFDCASNSGYYESQNVLSVTSVGATRECFHSRNIAPINQGPRLSGLGAAQYAVSQGAKSLSCVGNVLPNFGKWACDGLVAWGKQHNIKVQTFLGKPDASDAQTIVVQALNAPTDAVVEIDTVPQMAAYMKAAQQQQSSKPWYAPTSAYDLAFPKLVGPKWNKKLDVQIELAPLDSKGRDNQLWRAIMDRYAGSKAPRDSFSQTGFLAAKVFVDAVSTIKPSAIDRDSVTKALRAVKDFKTDLLCSPWYFGDGAEHNANNVGRIVKLTGEGNTGFAPEKGCTPVEDPDLASIRAAEAG